MYSYKKEVKIEKERIRRLVSWHNNKPESPLQIDVELHKRCNLNCLACSRSISGPDLNTESIKRELPLEIWLSVVKQARQFGIMVWNIEGANEPMAHPMTYSVMKSVKENGMYGIITTNGTLWNEEKMKELVKMEWDRVHFSIDAPVAQIHDYLRLEKGSFKRAISAIRTLNLYKKKFRTEWPMLNINMVVNNLNYPFIPDMVRMCHRLKADYMFLEPLITYHGDARKLKMNANDREALNRYIAEAEKLADRYRIDNNFATKDRNLSLELVKNTGRIAKVTRQDVSRDAIKGLLSVPCFKPWMTLAIKHDGLAGHCGLIMEGCSIKRTTLSRVWYGRKMESIRKRMLNQRLDKHCLKCCPSDITQRRRWRRLLEESLKNGCVKID